MAGELAQALTAVGITRYCVVGHALGALIGLQLALDTPDALKALVCVNGWLTLNAHTRRCFQIRERLLHAGGAQAWQRRSRCFSIRQTGWPPAHRVWKQKRHWRWRTFRQNNLLRRLNAEKADFSRHAARIACPVHLICSADDLLVPSVCSSELQAALPHSHSVVMRGRPCLQRHRAGNV